MFLAGLLAWLSAHVWLMPMYLRARSSFPSPLGPEEERQAIEAMRAGDGEAAHRLVEHNLRLVAHIARKYAQSGVEQEDLVSIGTLGLIKAVQTFKPESGRLAPYAARCIENEMLMALRANKKRRGTLLLGDPLGQDQDGNELDLNALLGTDPDMVSDLAEDHIEAGRALRMMRTALTERERRVVALRFGLQDGEPRPQHEVARALGISRSYVSRIEKKALQKLRTALGHD